MVSYFLASWNQKSIHECELREDFFGGDSFPLLGLTRLEKKLSENRGLIRQSFDKDSLD